MGLARVISTGYRLARALKHGPDRLLHRARRRAAMRRLRRLGVPQSVLFVCKGNICRSPYAERACAAAVEAEWSGISVPGGFEAHSAGFIGPGRASPPAAIEVAAERRVDLRDHRSTIVVPDSVEGADAIFVMTKPQRRTLVDHYAAAPEKVLLLGDFDPEAIDTRAIRDPVEQGRDVFVAVYARIDRCLDTVLEASGLASTVAVAGPTDP